ncbi:GNAT family N-acetyltransferase [Sphingosinicella sp.]|uniref:GNAT family N-acetyltransferase n=1 Tax=Sphingosinicella sp. TaxID=1917971 RepID=UPI004037FA29
MPASEVALPLRVGARTLITLRRRLARRTLSLDEALGGALPALPDLTDGEQGYFVTALPAALVGPLTAGRRALKPFVRQRYRRSYARLDQDFDTYFADFSAKSRSTCKRKLRKLAERSGGALDLRCYRTEDEIGVFYALARGLSAKTYQERRLGAGLPDGPQALAGMRALARADRARGWLLFVADRPVAYLWAPAEGLTLIYAYLGYDPDFADYSPGTVLQLEAMRQLMEERRFRLFDFTEGDGQHKRLFATDGVDCVDLLLMRRTPGLLATGFMLAAFDGAVALAKRVAGGGPARRPRR